MGLLPTDAKTAILSGVYRVIQIYTILVPDAAGSTNFEPKVIHNESPLKRVTDHGVITREAFNQTLIRPGKLRPGRYSFTAENFDDLFSLTSTLWQNSTTLYQAHPTECRVQRIVQIEKGSTLTFLLNAFYHGQISGLEYETNGTNPISATITCKTTEESKLTERAWNGTDFDELQLLDNGGSPLVFGGPVPGEN